MAKPTILVIEDEKNIQELIKYNLEQEGCLVRLADNGNDGLKLVKKGTPDLIVLDLMLPGIGGLDVCRMVRNDPKIAHVPILMLTAKSEETDKIIGLELGADDYVTKPFSPKEFIARVRALLRRVKNAPASKILKVGDLTVDLDRHLVTVKKLRVELTSKEYHLLKELMESHGRVLSRDYLLEQVWGYDQAMHIETRTVDMHVGQLRKKLKGEASRILTVKNEGYRMDNES